MKLTLSVEAQTETPPKPVCLLAVRMAGAAQSSAERENTSHTDDPTKQQREPEPGHMF